MTKRKRPAPAPRPSRRPLLLLAAGLLGLVLLVGGVWLTRSNPAVEITSDIGRLEATQATIDLGRVPLGQQANATFELVNRGATPVRLMGLPEVRTVEGC